jgi:hypothetical protein
MFGDARLELHCALPRISLRLVALMKFVRLSRKKQDAQGLKPKSSLGFNGPTKVVP